MSGRNRALLALATRVEREPASRELDVLVAQSVWPQLTHYGPQCVGDEPIFWEDPFRKMPCPEFTTSFDAAVRLVPEHHDYILEHVNGGLTICARVGHNDPNRNSWGDTDAQALTAAALRAHAGLRRVA